MITGELKNKVDGIWDTIWAGGITSPITVLEQITYLMFMKLLDDNQIKKEANANALGVPLKNKVFGDGECVISEEPRIVTDYKIYVGAYFTTSSRMKCLILFSSMSFRLSRL